MNSVVDSFFKNKKGKAKRNESDTVTRSAPKRQPFIPVRGTRPSTDKTAAPWQKRPNYTNFASEINRGSILSSKQIKKIVIDNVSGIDSVNSSGISMFAGLLDLGVRNAIRIANEIVRSARQQGNRSTIFGHAVHISIAQSHPEAKEVMSSVPSEQDKAYFATKQVIGQKRYEKISNTENFKHGIKIRTAYQKLLPVAKKYWKDIKAASAHARQLGETIPKITQRLGDLAETNTDVAGILERIYGPKYFGPGNTPVPAEPLINGDGDSVLVLSLYFMVNACSKWNHTDTAFFVMMSPVYNKLSPPLQRLITQHQKCVTRKMNQLYKVIDKIREGDGSGTTLAAYKKSISKAYSVFEEIKNSNQKAQMEGYVTSVQIRSDYRMQTYTTQTADYLKEIINQWFGGEQQQQGPEDTEMNTNV